MAETDIQNQKLILLYMLKQVPEITSEEWLRWAIESLYFDYFSFMQTKEELKKDHLLFESKRKNEKRNDTSGAPVERCDLTPEGETILQQLLPNLAPSIRSYLYEEGKKRKKTERENDSVLSSYSPDANGKYQVSLLFHEAGSPVMDITLSAPDEKHAKEICRHWKESTADIYVKILALLENNENAL